MGWIIFPDGMAVSDANVHLLVDGPPELLDLARAETAPGGGLMERLLARDVACLSDGIGTAFERRPRGDLAIMVADILQTDDGRDRLEAAHWRIDAARAIIDPKDGHEPDAGNVVELRA